MSTQTLRELAKDYAKGSISRDVYRKSRTELVQGIIAGDIVVKTIDYEAPLIKPPSEIEDAITEGISREKTQITSPQQIPKPKKAPPVKQSVAAKKKPPFIFISVSAVIVLSLITVVVLFYPKPPESASSKAANVSENTIRQNNTTTPTIAANKSVLGESLIADFLNEKNWNEDSLNKFIESWSALTQEERDSAKQTKRMQRMNDSIYKQFLEGKALASIDSEKALMKQQKLIDFARALGLNDSRLTLD